MSVVWIVDAEQWPRALLRAALIERGYDAVGYLNATDALQTIRSRFPDLIVVELRGVSREDVAQLFQIGVPVLGIASRPEPDWVGDFSWAAFLRRPVSIGEIAERVVEVFKR